MNHLLLLAALVVTACVPASEPVPQKFNARVLEKRDAAKSILRVDEPNRLFLNQHTWWYCIVSAERYALLHVDDYVTFERSACSATFPE